MFKSLKKVAVLGSLAVGLGVAAAPSTDACCLSWFRPCYSRPTYVNYPTYYGNYGYNGRGQQPVTVNTNVTVQNQIPGQQTQTSTTTNTNY